MAFRYIFKSSEKFPFLLLFVNSAELEIFGLKNVVFPEEPMPKLP
jgi:hypothetical protein